MLNATLAVARVVARKEIVDGLRDFRSVLSSVLYALMGPLVVGLVSLGGVAGTKPGSSAIVLASMMSVFTLVAAFVGGMNVAMDTIAGERERRSLLPLLLNPVGRLDVVLGKWLAVSLFAIGGFTLNLLGSAVILASSGMHMDAWPRLLAAIFFGLLPLPLFAASSTVHLNRLPRGEGSADLPVADRVSSDGRGVVSRVLSSGAAPVVGLPSAGGTSITARAPGERESRPTVSANRVGVVDRGPGYSCLAGCRQQVAA
jgi:hypothetical protein